MKKKASAKQNREAQEAARRGQFRAVEEQKKEQERLKREAEERERRRRQAILDREKAADLIDSTPKQRKSTAKAAGLKSTFILGENHLLMTSFGRGNHAVSEKEIVDQRVTDINPERAFTAIPEDWRYLIEGRVADASTDDPLHRAPESTATGDDLIHCRKPIERRFFGDNFDDNIHIQIAYSILDIEKLMASHVNNIIYSITNQLRDKIETHEDVIGYLAANSDYDRLSKNANKERLFELFQELARSAQLGYFGIQVIPEDEGKRPRKIDKNALQLSEREFFTALSAIGMTRQMLAHSLVEDNTNIYNIDSLKNCSIPALLTRLYTERVTALNAGFLDKAQRNLVIMFRAYGINDIEGKRRYVREYYDFTVRKEYKNQGFSIKTLREVIMRIMPDAAQIADSRYDSVRGKINPFFDFAIYHYYADHGDEAAALVDGLRACMAEDAKLDIYTGEARRVWPKLSGLILNHMLPQMSGDAIKRIGADPDVSADMLSGALIGGDASGFTKLIYMLTLFMDGKEINDLLTQLINKLENIAGFVDVLNERGIDVHFTKEYTFFANCWRAASELRTVNSFARMSKESTLAKKQMFIEAAQVLGYNPGRDELNTIIDDMLDKGQKGAPKKEMGVRNFIINNVIDTPRFKYLARYADVAHVSALSRSYPLVAYVLQDIPDKQIVRYYNACYGDNAEYSDMMRDALTRELNAFSFESLRSVRNNDRLMNQQEQEEKRRKQSLVRLYLTVLYLAVKNLVYVNSRYFLAFHCVERDRRLMQPDKWSSRITAEQRASDPATYGFEAFARDFLKQYPQKKRVQRYLEQNFANSDTWLINAFRNKVDHIEAVRSAYKYIGDVREIESWFALYHYIMQRTLIDQYEYDSHTPSHLGATKGQMIIDRERLNPTTIKYAQLVKRHGSYCKDAVKAMCVPFAYNLPRYKNLTIDALFDRNRPGVGGGDIQPDEAGEDS